MADMFPPGEDPLWSVERIADHLDVDNDWVLGFAREHGLELFDIGGGNLRARQGDVIRFALRNSRPRLDQPDFQRQERADDKPTGSAAPARKPPPDPQPPPDPLRGYRPYVSERGRDFDLFPIGVLAAVLNRKPDTIRGWEQQGWLPPAHRSTSDDPRGTRRRYTRAQILAIHRIAQEEGVLKPHARSIRDTRFVERVRAVFEEPPSEPDR
ncbi:MerR family transcriptional regulator [Streptosporangium sp. NPDC050280]|uniref:MerR family transcriptional regulator n=1 Tax=unclassified Streptosporangium TaxID=2632669 RepID=UPI0034457598